VTLNPGVIKMAAAQGASALGDAAATVTLTLRLNDTTHSSWLVATLMFVILGPSVVGAPVTGRLVSRFGARSMFVAAAAVQAAAACALAVTSGATPTLALAVVLGAGFAVAQPATLTMLPALTGEDGIVPANSLMQAVDTSAWLAGPLLGAGLLVLGAARVPLLLDAGSFAIAALLIGTIRPASMAGDPSGPPAGRRLLDGVRYVLQDRPLAGLIAIRAVMALVTAMASIAEVFLARDVLHADALGYASLGTGFMAASLVGNALTQRFSGRITTVVMIGVVVAGLGIAATGVAPTITVAIFPYSLAGLAYGMQSTANRSMMQRHVASTVPGDQRADVFAVLVAVAMGVQLAGFACGAAVIAAAGPRQILLLAGAGAALAGLAGYVRWSAWFAVMRARTSAERG
jgi:MFS family permease